jgi:hypothetical protein
MYPFKIIGAVVSNANANNIGRATALYAVSIAASTLTIANTSGTVGSIVVPPYTPVLIRKNADELVTYAGSVTPVSLG